MAVLNKWMGIGNLGRDPEVRYMPDGKAVANISIACTEKYKDKSGEQKEATEWVNVVFFGRLAEIVGEYLKKGMTIYVEGKMKTDKYTDKNTGVEKFSTKIVGESMQMLGGGQREGGQRERPAAQKPSGGNFDDMTDDIPF
jgi:single-strand DNA-binding protein